MIAVAAFVAGAAGAWLLRGVRENAAIAGAQARMQSLQQQLGERGGELEATRFRHEKTVELLRAESGAKAAAEEKAARVPDLETRLAERDRLLAQAGARLAELETRLTEERKASDEKLALLDDAQRKLSDAFKALSSEALKSNNQSFIELAKATLEKFQESAKGDLEKRQKAVDELVKPIRESLEKVDGKLG
ncbi:MAG: hypothetical protein ACREVC_14090, partial [Burkholderiales bacterium]